MQDLSFRVSNNRGTPVEFPTRRILACLGLYCVGDIRLKVVVVVAVVVVGGS